MKISALALTLIICSLPSTSAVDHLRVRRRQLGDRNDRGHREAIADVNAFILDGGDNETGFLDLDSSNLSMSLAMTSGVPSNKVSINYLTKFVFGDVNAFVLRRRSHYIDLLLRDSQRVARLARL